MKKVFKPHQGAHGVALLFALGILSLLLILGLAFVSNALLAQKIASNNSNRTLAKMLAQSAISRIAAGIRIYHVAYLGGNFDTDELPNNFSSLCSYQRTTTTGTTTDTSISDDSSSDVKKCRDQLEYSSKTLTNYFSKLAYPGNALNYTASTSNAMWEYIYDNYRDKNNRKIIGRVAFQVLPPMSSSHLNLQQVLEGILARSKFLEGKVNDYQGRLGQDIDELNLEYARCLGYKSTSDAWSYSSTVLKDCLSSSFIPEYYDELYTSYWDDIGTGNDYAQKYWIERWFAEGEDPSEPEAYRYVENNIDGYAYRFNLNVSPDSGFYVSASSNSDSLVNVLTGNSKEFSEWSKKLPSNYGIPFLRKIGDSTGSFETWEAFRKQIAANLNDYCDGDSIPTSDQNAYGWSQLIYEYEPTYTGNEKTPYINEFGFRFKVFPTDETNNDTKSIQLDTVIVPEIIVELIDIYGNPSTHYTYVGNVKKLNVNMKVVPVGEVTYEKTITVDGVVQSTTTETRSFPRSDDEINTLSNNIEYNLLSSADTTRTVNIEFNDKSFSKGYIVSSASLVDSSSNDGKYVTYKTGNLWNTIWGLVPQDEENCTYECKKIEIKCVRYQVTEGSFEMGAMCLYDNEAETKNGYPLGVDFVRTPRAPEGTSKSVPICYGTAKLKEEDDYYPFKGKYEYDKDEDNNVYVNDDNVAIKEGCLPLFSTNTDTIAGIDSCFYIGGAEVIDPRQNLNVYIYEPDANTHDISKTDWIYNCQIGNYENRTKTLSRAAISMTTTETGSDTDVKVQAQGLRNSVTNARPGSTPDDGEYYSETIRGKFNNADFDPEVVYDPAWRDATETGHLSTAVIANKGMESLWELGAIHRAAPWQTINLKCAGSPSSSSNSVQLADHTLKAVAWDMAVSGVSYANGDGGLLDEVAISKDKTSRNYGKVDVNVFWKDDPQLDDQYKNASTESDWSGYERDMVGALFQGLKYGQDLTAFDENNVTNTSDSGNGVEKEKGKPDPETGTTLEIASTEDKRILQLMRTAYGLSKDSERKFTSRAQFVDWYPTNDRSLVNAFGLIDISKLETDAAQEEIIGKTVNLLSASSGALPTVVQVLIVAQTIRDIEGANIVRKSHDGTKTYKENCSYGHFLAVDDGGTVPTGVPPYVYFDEITGECKIVVTFDRLPDTGQLMVRKIEYID